MMGTSLNYLGAVAALICAAVGFWQYITRRNRQLIDLLITVVVLLAGVVVMLAG